MHLIIKEINKEMVSSAALSIIDGDQESKIDEETTGVQEKVIESLHEELITSKETDDVENEDDNLSESSEEELNICILSISEHIMIKYKETIGNMSRFQQGKYNFDKARVLISSCIKRLLSTELVLRDGKAGERLVYTRVFYKLSNEGERFDAHTIFPYDLEATLNQVFQEKLSIADKALAKNRDEVKNSLVEVKHSLSDEDNKEEAKISNSLPGSFENDEKDSRGVICISDRTRTSITGVAEVQTSSKGDESSLVDIDADIGDFENTHSLSSEKDHLDVSEQKVSQDISFPNRSKSTRISELNAANILREKNRARREKKELKRQKDEKKRKMEEEEEDRLLKIQKRLLEKKNEKIRQAARKIKVGARENEQEVNARRIEYGNELLSCSQLFFLSGALGSRLVLEALQVCLQEQSYYLYDL
jgi:hypothetical protein